MSLDNCLTLYEWYPGLPWETFHYHIWIYSPLSALSFVPYCILSKPISMMSLYKSDKFSTRMMSLGNESIVQWKVSPGEVRSQGGFRLPEIPLPCKKWAGFILGHEEAPSAIVLLQTEWEIVHTGVKLTATVTPCNHYEIWGHVLTYVIGNMWPFPLVQMQSQCGRNPPCAPAWCLPEWS